MDKLCKNCKYWSNGREFAEEQHYNASHLSDVTYPDGDMKYQVMPDEEAKKLTGRIVRHCIQPLMLFYERPAINGLAVFDGSEYMAGLVTGEEFGCVNFEPKI